MTDALTEAGNAMSEAWQVLVKHGTDPHDRMAQARRILAEAITKVTQFQTAGEAAQGEPRDEEVEQALQHIGSLCQFAYDQGFHELGYDPLRVVRAALAAQAPQAPAGEAMRAAFTEWFDRRDGIRNPWTAYQEGYKRGKFAGDPETNKWWFDHGKKVASMQAPAAPDGQLSGSDGLWSRRWYGSPPDEGWSIMRGRDVIAVLGRNVLEKAVDEIIDAHNYEREKAREGPLVGDQIPADQFARTSTTVRGDDQILAAPGSTQRGYLGSTVDGGIDDHDEPTAFSQSLFPVEGYVDAFYELATLMGIGAQDASPETVWREQMLPTLRKALAVDATTQRAPEPAGVYGKWRKKPVVISAFSWDGTRPVSDTPNWFFEACSAGKCWPETDGTLRISTLEGEMTAQVGDWIIQGVKGELYPCKPDIFAATYEPADATHALRAGRDAEDAGLIPICSRVLAAFREMGVAEHPRETYAARHECESAILALDKAIDAARKATAESALRRMSEIDKSIGEAP